MDMRHPHTLVWREVSRYFEHGYIRIRGMNVFLVLKFDFVYNRRISCKQWFWTFVRTYKRYMYENYKGPFNYTDTCDVVADHRCRFLVLRVMMFLGFELVHVEIRENRTKIVFLGSITSTWNLLQVASISGLESGAVFIWFMRVWVVGVVHRVVWSIVVEFPNEQGSNPL